jgi:hypothetical protein
LTINIQVVCQTVVDVAFKAEPLADQALESDECKLHVTLFSFQQVAASRGGGRRDRTKQGFVALVDLRTVGGIALLNQRSSTYISFSYCYQHWFTVRCLVLGRRVRVEAASSIVLQQLLHHGPALAERGARSITG